MPTPTPIPWIDFHGQPAVRLHTSWGDCVTVLQQGGQVVSWQTADGVEHLYLSPKASWNGQDAIRGGVPVCFPQFNLRGPLVKHGFVRHLPWQVVSVGVDSLCLALESGTVTRCLWPHEFRLELTVSLRPATLRMALQATNTGAAPWAFTAALHTYLQVEDVLQVQLQGLDGAQRWDAVRDVHSRQEGPVVLGPEFDSVFQAAPEQRLRLSPLPPANTFSQGAAQETRGVLDITQSASCPQTVVWNPAETLSTALADMPDDGWRHMLCVEAASIDAPVTLAPQAHWQAWQELHWQP